MIIRERAVNVIKLPATISPASHQGLMRVVSSVIEVKQPRIVLDCSSVEFMGSGEIGFLLTCLEEVMKRNGDVRLATLLPHANAILQSVGVARLFEIYETAEIATDSYKLRSVSMAPLHDGIAA